MAEFTFYIVPAGLGVCFIYIGLCLLCSWCPLQVSWSLLIHPLVCDKLKDAVIRHWVLCGCACLVPGWGR